MKEATKKLNGQVITAVKEFFGSKERPAKADTNELMPVILDIISGEYPTKRILSGTTAKLFGFEVGNVYLAKYEEKEEDEDYGRQFNWSVIMKLSLEDVITHSMKFGAPQAIEVMNKVSLPVEEKIIKDEIVFEKP